MPGGLPKPDPFLEVRVHDLGLDPTLCGLCVGYESGVWRAKQLADHIVEWLPEFALSSSEISALDHATAVPFIRRAARTVYESKKFHNRGEFGELFLHAAIRQVHDSLPAISKIFYKSAANDTVKGFDAVHVVGQPHDMELWLGEAKFYTTINKAISDVLAELDDHLKTDYLRTEFILITNKLDNSQPHSAQLKKLLSPNTSLDEVFKRVCIPILLTYDSACLATHTHCTPQYNIDFTQEVMSHHSTFAARLATRHFPPELRLHLFLMPLSTKKDLIMALDKKLKTWQQL